MAAATGGGRVLLLSTVNEEEVRSSHQAEVPPPPTSYPGYAGSPESSPGCLWNIRDSLSSHPALT